MNRRGQAEGGSGRQQSGLVEQFAHRHPAKLRRAERRPQGRPLYVISPRTLRQNAHAGGSGARLTSTRDDDDPELAGILFGVGTFGDTDQSVTAGLGYGFVDGDLASKPMAVLGGEARLSPRAALLSENWVFPGMDGALLSYGVRLFGEKISVDLAFINVTQEPILPGVPYIDFVVNF